MTPDAIDLAIDSLDGPIVVMGAGGFVGANLTLRLARRRCDVFAVTNQSYRPWRLQDFPANRVLTCNIANPSMVREMISRYAFRTYFVLSAYGAYARQRDWTSIYQTNVMGLINVLDAAQVHGFSALVHAGSSSEYGNNSAGPAESDATLPNSHYAISKVTTSHIIHLAGTQDALPVNHLRYYSVYGPLEESDRLIPRLVSHAMNGKLPPLVNPAISRDFVFVDDAVDATILSAARGVKSAPGAVINVASGNKTTLSQLVDRTRKVFSVKEEPQWGSMGNRAWDLEDWYGNPALAKKLLGWQATTPLETGLVRTQQWLAKSGAPPLVVSAIDETRPVRLSAIIACYKDAQAIPIMHRRLVDTFQRLGVDYEIIFVNDCSPDNTSQVLEEICAKDPHVIGLEHSRNFGSQSAFLSGMSVSTGHAVALLDGDLQDPPELLATFYQRWLEGNEVVYGRRVKREASLVLQVCYKAFYRLFRHVSYVSVPLDAGDFSLIDRRIVDQLVQMPETDQFLRGLRAWVGFKQVGVDYVRPERMFGVTTNNWLKNFWWARKAIFSFSFVPLDAMLYSGLLVTAFASIALVGQLVYRLLHPEMPHGTATIIMLILLFGGSNILAVSILGEYLGKVLEETKRRPKFIRRQIRVGKRTLDRKEKIEQFVTARSKSTQWFTPELNQT